MANALFLIGDEVRIIGGDFAGMEGVVVSPTLSVGSPDAAALSASHASTVTVATIIDGHSINLRLPPVLLQSLAD